MEENEETPEETSANIEAIQTLLLIDVAAMLKTSIYMQTAILSKLEGISFERQDEKIQYMLEEHKKIVGDSYGFDL